MLLYKFIIAKILQSILLSSIIISSVLYIFSIIELLNDSYNFSNTLILGLLNTLELIITIPTIVFVMSIILFWNNIKKTNELIIIRHYIKFNKLLLILSLLIAIFGYFEINKSDLNTKVTNLKEIYLKQSINNTSDHKIFFVYDENLLTITRLDGITDKYIDEVSVYEFENNIFTKSMYSNINIINNKSIIMKNPTIITKKSIQSSDIDFLIKLDNFGQYFYNKDIKISIRNNKVNAISLLKKIVIILSLYTYVVILISKKAIQKNTSVTRYIIFIFLIFIYTFMTSQIYLENYNTHFQISVLLIFLLNLYKNLINE